MLKNPVDYLSFDIDEASFDRVADAAVRQVAVPRAITIEHDAYRHKDKFRRDAADLQRRLSTARGGIVYYLWEGALKRWR